MRTDNATEHEQLLVSASVVLRVNVQGSDQTLVFASHTDSALVENLADSEHEVDALMRRVLEQVETSSDRQTSEQHYAEKEATSPAVAAAASES